MYNGIGLSTPRGSGTNGYVVRNLGNLRPRRDPYGSTKQDQSKDDPTDPLALLGRERDFTGTKRANAELLRHEQKRQIEVRCFALQDQLEDDEHMTSAQIATKVQALRQKLLAELERQTTATAAADANAKSVRPYETHALSDAKERDNARMRCALGITEKNSNTSLRHGESAVEDQEEGEVPSRSAARNSSPPPRRRRSRSRDRRASTHSHRYRRDSASSRRHGHRRASPSVSSGSESSDASSETPPRRSSHRSRHRHRQSHRRAGHSSSRSRSPPRRHRSLSRSASRSISRSLSRSPRP
ncbi:RNA-splicing factor [Dimargaris verticillata]|uniref:RNA-splicing factor n=1 Tax=Dimargaris verticillata TaxID=2761393 RepID=A0A9W8AY72_9FUNG|nr:RNA-splicing factor [Dimargaris verticillata]